jgi:UDP-N-acetylmuramoyl-tripeptide--D-alanyl-D-alanine ligase
MNINEVRDSLCLSPILDDKELTGISTDSRTIKPGMLFVALRGENYDGHDYVLKAFDKGASAAVVDTLVDGCSGHLIEVSNTLLAYGQIAGRWRSRFSVPIVAVTGSVGKTTMKEMIALALSPIGTIVKTERNENNEVGLPLTLLNLSPDSAAAVLEMGMRGFGQIKYLAEIAKPTIGMITMIGESHIELVGSREGIARAKAELLESLGENGIAILNADDPFYGTLASRSKARIISFGRAESADVKVVRESMGFEDNTVELSAAGETVRLTLSSVAAHDAVNAAGAVATALALGINAKDAANALREYRSSHMRMEVLYGRTGATILSDCYNAAPSSVKSALRTLAVSGESKTKSAFLGDMRELGDFTDEMHADVATEASGLGLDRIYPIGESMKKAFPRAPQSFVSADQAVQFIGSGFLVTEQDVVLVKGSRALELEKVVAALVNL